MKRLDRSGFFVGIIFGCLIAVGCGNKAGLAARSSDGGAGDGLGQGDSGTGLDGGAGNKGAGGVMESTGLGGIAGAGGMTGGAGMQATGGRYGSVGAGGAGGTSTGTQGSGGVAGAAGAGTGVGGTGENGSGGSKDAGTEVVKQDAAERGEDAPDTDTGFFACDPPCAIYCPYGSALDDRGCPTCECLSAPSDAGAGRDAVVCGPACDLYCPNGNVLDTNGCATCKCKATPVICAEITCKPCLYGYLVDSNNCQTCDCASVPPDLGCAGQLDMDTCTANDRCRWLDPGCGKPSLAAAGCYEETTIGCTTDDDCSNGRACLKRVINPCMYLDCLACGETISLCL